MKNSKVSLNNYAVELSFDPITEQHIRTIWQAIADAGISSFMVEKPFRPHFSLAVCGGIDIEKCETLFNEFAQNTAVFEVNLPYIGIFQALNSVVYLGVTNTAALIQLHTDFIAQLTGIAQNIMPYYLPNQWIPHVTLAFEIPSGRLTDTIVVCQQAVKPVLNGYAAVQHIGLIEVATGDEPLWVALNKA